MVLASDLSQVLSTRQLYRYKVTDRDVELGDFVMVKVKDEPTVYNNYSSAVHSYLAVVKDIVINEQRPNNTEYLLDIYEDGLRRSVWRAEKWQLRDIQVISVPDAAYEKAKIALEKKIAKEEKLQAELAEQRRRDEEANRIFQENLRKQEEADRLAKIQAEEERRAEPMYVTVGMWEDMMKQIRELSKTVSDMESDISGLRYRCYGPGLDE